MKRLILLMVVLSMQEPTLAQVPTEGLVAHYPLDGDAVDISVNGNNGTNYGATPTVNRLVGIGQALEFDGDTSYIQIPRTSQNQPGTGSFAVCGWFKVNYIDTSKSDFYFYSMDGPNYSGYSLYWDTKKTELVLDFHYDDHWNHHTWIKTSAANLISGWHFFAGILDRDSVQMRLYVDESLVGSQPIDAQPITATGSDLYFGRRRLLPEYEQRFSGCLDDIRIYSRALTALEIDALYREVPTVRSLTLLSPIGGEIWPVGSTQTLRWTSSGVANVKIEYTTNNGGNWSTIIATTPADTHWFAWTIPNVPSRQCRVRISDELDLTTNSVSADSFGIYRIDVFLSGPFAHNSCFYPRNAVDQNRIHLNVKLKLIPGHVPLSNIQTTVLLDGSPMTLALNTIGDTLDLNDDGVIDRLPSIRHASHDSIEFVASSQEFAEHQANKSVEARVMAVDGVPASFGALDTVSIFFAMHPSENRPFSLLRDGYSFENPDRPGLGEFVFLLLRHTISLDGINVLYYTYGLFRGRCFGMSATSGTYFLFPNQKPLDGDVHSWSRNNVLVMDNIDVAQVVQAGYTQTLNWNVTAAYDSLLTRLKTGQPAVLSLKGHANLATKITHFQCGKVSYIDVYENEVPGTSTAAKVDHRSNTFDYFGDDTCFAVYPSSVFTDADLQYAVNKFLRSLLENLVGSNQQIFSVACPVNLHVRNSRGQRFGYLPDGQIAHEIAGGHLIRVPTGGSSGDSLTIIFVPNDDEYRAEMHGYDSGSMRFEYIKAIDSGQLFTSTIDSIGLVQGAVCYFEESDSLHFYVDNLGDGIIDTVQTRTRSIVVDAKETGKRRAIPSEILLSQNYPNPFNPSTIIRYGLPQRSAVQLTVFNTLGQLVATLVQGEQEAGYHEVKFDAAGLSSGVYFYRLRAGDCVSTKRLLVLR